MEKIVRKNGELWYDTNGEAIHAHGGFILEHDDYFYWYGEDRRENYYVSCYRSSDLVHWEFRNHVITTTTPTSEIRIRTKRMLQSETGGKVNLERPKVIYNKKTQKFVLWVHFENGENYNDAAVAIATSDYPDSGFVYHGHFNPFGYMSRDCTLFVDTDDTAYFISAARDNADLHVYQLSDDYMNVDSLVHKLWQGEYREAPAVVKHEDEYLMLSSFCTGWDPNQAKFSVSKAIHSHWSVLQEIGDETTYGSQPAFLLKYKDQILYFGDRWQGGGEAYFTSGYTIYPLIKDELGWHLKKYDEVIFDETGISFR